MEDEQTQWLVGGRLGDSALWVTAHTGKRKLEPSGPALSHYPHRWRPLVTPTWWCRGSRCGMGGCTPPRWPAWPWRCWTRCVPSASGTGPRSSCACASASTRVRLPEDRRPAPALSSHTYTRTYTFTYPLPPAATHTPLGSHRPQTPPAASPGAPYPSLTLWPHLGHPPFLPPASLN